LKALHEQEFIVIHRASHLIVLVAFCLGAHTPASAQRDADLRKELDALKQGQAEIQRQIALEDQIEALRKGQEAMQRQLDEIKALLQARPAAAPAAAPAAPAPSNVAGMEFDLSDTPIKGQTNAALTLIEFTDYQCPYCSRFTTNTLPEIVKTYIDSGKLRLALMDLPLEAIHAKAFKAAEATQCAREQGKFWEMHDRLFASQQQLDPWKPHAEALSLDVAKFEACLESGRHADGVRADMALAQKAGISGTPSFVLGRTDPANPNKVTGIQLLRGAQQFNAFKTAIDSALPAGQ
jgi:protein-disulfide isomerase